MGLWRNGTRIDLKKTGERIRFFMEREQMSVSQGAEYLQVTPSTIYNYLNGYNLPGTEQMYFLCKMLNVDSRMIIVDKEDEGDEWRPI